MAGSECQSTFRGELNRLTRFLCLILFAVQSSALFAQGLVQPESIMLGERPSKAGEPTLIEVGVFVIDIDEIDDVKQRFSIDLFIVASWLDLPALTGPVVKLV